MLVIGLTGGIGSGKTMATDYLQSLGITIVDADLASRVIVEPGQPALDEIANVFGAHLIEDGRLNRAALREIVFADPTERKRLEAITHPRIAQEILRQLNASTSPYTVLVSPLLFESSQSRFAQRTLLIDAPEQAQKSRASQRDGVNEAQIAAIMAAQMTREQRRERADDIILNDGDPSHLQAALDTLHQQYLEMARHSGTTDTHHIKDISENMQPQIKCPRCQTPVIWSAESPFRPFCSARCKLIDLGAWADESHRIAGSEAPPDGDF